MLGDREIITIRAAFRYTSRDVLEDAMWAMRTLLDRRPALVRFRCWVTTRNTLSIDLAVPMFFEDDVAPALCEVLGATATAARCVVRSKARFADGTGGRSRAPSPDLTQVLDELEAMQ